MIAALSTGHKVGLIVVAAIFIGFALLSAFVLPRRDPDFPGNRMGAFIGATVLLFVAMLAAVFIFGSEPKETREGITSDLTVDTTTLNAAVAAFKGDPAKGKALFASKSCGGCHSIDGSFIAGPSLKDVAGSRVTLADGTTVTADDAYLIESIEDPGKQVVKCPNCGPPSVMLSAIPAGSVSKTDAADLAAYIKTLH